MQVVRYRVGSGRKYRIKGKRFYPIMALFTIFLILLILNLAQKKGFDTQYKIGEFYPKHLEVYFDAGSNQSVPWYYLLAIDRAEGVSKEDISLGRSEEIALHLRGIASSNDLSQKLKDYNNDFRFIKRIEKEIKRLGYIIEVYDNKIFPVSGEDYSYEDGYGDGRTYGGNRLHEGIDIMCDMDTPLLSVCQGKVEKKGWLELGGWRIGIRGDDGIYYYYAHLSRYAQGLEIGHRVKKGQIVGYAGDTGYGDVGTTGKFKPHLHFGMYEEDSWVGSREKAINPYPFLKAWEKISENTEMVKSLN